MESRGILVFRYVAACVIAATFVAATEASPLSAREVAAAGVTNGLWRGAVFARGNAGAVGIVGEAAPGRPMTERTLFDLASVTKTFTAAAAALLVSEGKLEATNLHALATHTITGKFKYDCANFVALGDAVERASGMRLDRFCRERIFRPLGMTRTVWGPVTDDGTLAQMLPAGTPPGVISDLRARAAGRPIGNAGAFSDIRDMRLFVTDLLTRKTFPKAYYDLLFTCRHEEAGGIRRSFGFDMSDGNRPAGLSRSTIYHSGWTGQTIAIDPETGFCGVVLTARTGDHDKAIKGRRDVLSALVLLPSLQPEQRCIRNVSSVTRGAANMVKYPHHGSVQVDRSLRNGADRGAVHAECFDGRTLAQSAGDARVYARAAPRPDDRPLR